MKRLVMLALSLVASVTWAGETFPLLDGNREAVIVGTGDVLRNYVEQSTGRKLRAVAEKDYKPATMPYAIFVGDSAKARELFGDKLKTLGVDDYIVHVAPNLVVLAGATDETRLWAQYDFLREYLGVDCYFPHPLGIIVPKHDQVLIPAGTRLERPVFKNRGLWGFNAAGKGDRGWCQGVIPWRVPPGEQRGPMASHTVQKLITVKEYGKTHTEYFPLIDGKRKLVDGGSDPAPCTSNPEVVKIAIDKIRAYFDANPKEQFYSLGMTDGGYCQCDSCLALDGPPLKIEGCERGKPVVRRWFSFLNQVAAAVRQSHPGKVITTLGYAGCEVPPADLKLEPNIMPFLCWSHACWFDPEVKRVNLAVTDAWLERLDQIGLYEYHYGASLAIPMLYTHDMADYLRHVARGARNKDALAIFVEANCSWGMDGPKTWILEKLLWNPEQDVDQLAKRWCDAVFAEASPAMLRYFQELESLRVKNGAKLKGISEFVPWKGKSEPLSLQDIFGLWQKSCQLLLFPPEDVARCQAILEEAKQAAKQDVVKQRIDYFASTFKLTEHASKTYQAYAKLGEMTFAGTEPQTLLTALVEGDAKAPEADALEYAQQLMTQDNTKFNGPTITLSGCGLAVREIVQKTAGKAIAAALAAGERDRKKLADVGVAALMAAAPPQELSVTPVGQKRLEMLRSVAARVATAPTVKTAPVIDGKPDEPLWQWVDQRPWFKWQSTMPDAAPTQFAFAHDGQFLYLALRCPQANLAAQKRCPAQYGAPAYQFPSVELFLNADQPGVAPDKLSFYQAIPAFGGGFMECGGGKIGDKPAAMAAYAMTDDANEWRAEMKIDLKKLGLAGKPWLRFNLVRNLGAGGFSGLSWFPSPSAHKEGESRGWLVLEDADNLLQNGGFSDWKAGDKRPLHWDSWDNALRPGELSNGDGAHFVDGGQEHQLTQAAPVQGGAKYELACLKKVQLGSNFLLVAVQWKDKSYKGVGYSMALDGGYDADFQPLRKVFEAPKDAVTAIVIVGPYCVNRKGAVAKGSMWIKDVSFGPAPARQEEPKATASDPKAFEANLRKLCSDRGQAFGVGAATESDKLYPDTLYHGSLTDPIHLALAGGEYGSFQLAVIPFWADLKDVTVSFSPLREKKSLLGSVFGSEGKEISPDNLKWFRVAYVKLEKPNAWLGLDYKHPAEPDPLLPAAPFDVKAGTLAAVWGDVYLPPGTPEGSYEGTVTVTANGQKVERPLEVESYGFDIPKTSSVANEFWWCPSNWNKFYGYKMKYTPELHAKHAATLGRYRVSSFPCDWITLCPQVTIYAEPDGHFSFDWTTFDKYVKTALDNGTTAFWNALSCNSGWTRYLHNPSTKVVERTTGKTVELGRYLPPMKEKWLPLEKLPYRDNKVYREFLQAYVKHLKALGINDRCVYELFDEPGGDRFLEMLRHHQYLRDTVPDLKLGNFGQYPSQEVEGKNAVGLVDVWPPHLEILDKPGELDALYARRAKHGEKVWAYSCIEYRRSPDGKVSYASRFTEDNYSPFCVYHRPYIATRIHAWMAWKYRLDGFYIFMMNAVPDVDAKATPRWPATEWSDGAEKGSGTLVYPGENFEIVPGMRLANIRGGLQDYEYFALLKKLSGKLDKDSELSKRVAAALEVDTDIVGSVFDWTKDRERLEAKRHQLAALIKEVKEAR